MAEPVGRLGSVALDCQDPRELAAFWARMLGGQVGYASDAFCTVALGHLVLVTVRVPDYRRPVWPDGQPKQFHLDVAVGDLDKAEVLALEAGAARAEPQPNPGSWRVMLDPAGHPFCLTTLLPQ